VTLTRAEQEAQERARELLTATELIEGRGAAAKMAPKARMLARDVLEFANRLEQERSARQAIQADRDRLRQLLTGVK
jgi:hypothetical protein